jgi:hypothetical protein
VHVVSRVATRSGFEARAGAGWRDSCGTHREGGALTMYIGGGLLLVIIVIILLIWVF